MRIFNFFKSGDDLSEKVSRGIVWVFLRQGTLQTITIVKLVIVARIIGPAAYGIMAIALITISLLNVMSNTGIGLALIQKTGDIEPYLNTAWSIKLLRSVILFLIILIMASPISIFFDAPESKLVIIAVGSIFLLEGLSNIGMIYFQKEIKFEIIFVWKVLADITDAIVAIVSVFILESVWALVLGKLANNIVSLLLSYKLQPFRPRFHLEKEYAKSLLRYGKWVFLSGILGYLILEGDDIFVGAFLGVTALGFYKVAFRIGRMPVSEISAVISQVAVPTYAKIQDDQEKLKQAYLTILRFNLTIISFLVGMVLVFAEDFVHVVFGPEWEEIVQPMQILIISGYFGSISSPSTAFFLGTGRPKIISYLQVIRLATIASTIYYFTNQYGITGTALVIMGSMIIFVTFVAIITLRILDLRLNQYFKSIFVPFLNMLIVSAIVYLMRSQFASINFFVIMLLGTIGGLIYLAQTYFFDRIFNYNLYPLLKKNFKTMVG